MSHEHEHENKKEKREPSTWKDRISASVSGNVARARSDSTDVIMDSGNEGDEGDYDEGDHDHEGDEEEYSSGPKYFKIEPPVGSPYWKALEAGQDASPAMLNNADEIQRDIDGLCSFGFANCIAISLRSKDGVKNILTHISSFEENDTQFLNNLLKDIGKGSFVRIITNKECADGDKGLSQEEKDDTRASQKKYLKNITKTLNAAGDYKPSVVEQIYMAAEDIAIKRDGRLHTFSQMDEDSGYIVTPLEEELEPEEGKSPKTKGDWEEVEKDKLPDNLRNSPKGVQVKQYVNTAVKEQKALPPLPASATASSREKRGREEEETASTHASAEDKRHGGGKAGSGYVSTLSPPNAKRAKIDKSPGAGSGSSSSSSSGLGLGGNGSGSRSL